MFITDSIFIFPKIAKYESYNKFLVRPYFQSFLRKYFSNWWANVISANLNRGAKNN